jgi:transglutaminase-like putative cysteine protease
MMRRALIASILLCAAALQAFAAAPSAGARSRPYEVGAPPAWIGALEPAQPQAASVAGAGAVDYLLVDRQVSLEDTAEYYSRYVAHLRNETGVKDRSQLSIDFDPERESLRIHRVTIRRGTQVIDGLATGRIEMLQRERELEQGLLDGALTFHLLLSDVRVGDIIDYSFTVRRRYPEWGNRHYARFVTGWDDVVRLSRLKVRSSSDRYIKVANHDGTEPVETVQANWRTFEWHWRDRAGDAAEPEAPDWYTQHPYIEVSQFANWKDVALAAVPLYEVSGALGPELTELSQRLRGTDASPGAQALAVIRFVQEEIRYTGMELGAGAFRPARPQEVLRRRFGDCKDKALLAVTLLRALGIEAAPALVSTTWRGHLGEHLPGYGAFDHVIVRVRINGSSYWWDATATGQGGGFRDFVQSDLGAALVVARDSGDIERIEQIAPDEPQTSIRAQFDLRSGLDKDSVLAVSTEFRGAAADHMRRTLRRTTLKDLGRNYEDYYKRYYPKVRLTAEPQLHDDLAGNRLVLDERYAVSNLFEIDDGKKSRRVFSLNADQITAQLAAPDKVTRRTPLEMHHPYFSAVHLEIRLPEEWPVDESAASIEDPAFRFTSRARRSGNDVYLDYEYRSLADHVPAKLLDAHLQRREKARQQSLFTLSYTVEQSTMDEAKARKLLQRAAAARAEPANAAQILRSLVEDDHFGQLSAPLRDGAWWLYAGVAADQEKWRVELQRLKNIGTTSPASEQAWLRRVHASLKLEEYDDAADSLVTVIQHWPRQFARLDDDVVAQAVARGTKVDSIRYRLLSALQDVDYRRHDKLDISEWWRDLALLQLERGEAERARKTVAGVSSPQALVSIRVDNRFAAVRNALKREQEVGLAQDRSINELRQLAKRKPREMGPALDLTYGLLRALRYDEVLSVCDQVIARTRRPGGAKYFTDYDTKYQWILDNRARALAGLQRWEDGLAQMAEARHLALQRGDRISQFVNLASMYNDLGRAEDAMRLIKEVKDENASVYGRMQVAAIKVDSAAQLGDTQEVERQLAYLHQHRKESPAAYQDALLRAGRVDEASTQLVARLADPEQRLEALLEVQNYQLPPMPSHAAEIQSRWKALLRRSEVEAAIHRYGVVSSFPLGAELH